MGRGVETIGENVLYFDASDEWYREEMAWDDLIENLQYTLSKAFPSFANCDHWAGYPYRENRAILENDHAIVYITEYMGCGAVNLASHQGEWSALADHWLDQIRERFTKIVGENVNLLTKLGTFSNGESVFEKRG